MLANEALARLPAIIQSHATLLFVVAACAALYAYVKLTKLEWVIAPPQRATQQHRKVFVVGLSRTGTTSICEALTRIGWRAFHQLQPLFFDLEWADAFDASSDVATAARTEDLMARHPDALFVLTTRDAAQWGAAMQRFVHSPVRRALLASPTRDIFAAVYGDDWPQLRDAAAWQQRYTAHERRVRRAAAAHSVELLMIDVGDASAVKWHKLCDAIGMPAPAESYPNAGVFRYSLVTQPIRQCRWAARRFWLPLLVFCLFFALALGTFEYGQCGRACAHHYSDDAAERLMQSRIGGTWRWPSAAACECWADGGDDAQRRRLGAVPRYNAWRPWNWPYESGAVCALATPRDAPAAAARTVPFASLAVLQATAVRSTANESYEVLNCGLCGRCSTLHDIEAYHRYRASTTRRATVAALARLFLGERAAYAATAALLGFSDACATCWVDNMACTTVHCFRECIFGGNPLNRDNNEDARNGTLNACLECDENYCSHMFLGCAGANRRSGGIVTDIGRVSDQICPFGYGRRLANNK